MNAVLRFAPSPNGRLHLGHAYSALLNDALARKLAGRFLLRMEDIDITRCTRELAAQIVEDLQWLGLTWEEPMRVQSHHWDDYRQALEVLKVRGLVYPCFCSRSEIAALSTGKDPDGAPLYPGTCRHATPQEIADRITKGEPHSWRLNMVKASACAATPLYYRRFTLPSLAEEIVMARPERWGDVILARKETPTSYHLSVTVDDALQHITHVVRGVDLEAATCIHVLLQSLLGLPTPLYHHHSLLTADDGEKLSKRKNSEPLAELREHGVTPEAIRSMLALPI